ncbi:hypothetical protein ACS0TY_016849 [Phlomoides rotata]
MWVRVYDVPLAFHMERAIRLIAGQIGRLDCYETPSFTEPEAFLRLKAHIDVSKPLLCGLSIKFGSAPVVIPLKFESLPLFCYCCGVMGHHFRGHVLPLIGMPL